MNRKILNGVDVVLCSIRQQVFGPLCFTEHGIDPMKYQVVVVKSTQHFQAGFAPLASSIVYCDAPGTTTNDFRTLPYRNARRPVYPLDADSGLCVQIWPINSASTTCPIRFALPSAARPDSQTSERVRS